MSDSTPEPIAAMMPITSYVVGSYIPSPDEPATAVLIRMQLGASGDTWPVGMLLSNREECDAMIDNLLHWRDQVFPE